MGIAYIAALCVLTVLVKGNHVTVTEHRVLPLEELVELAQQSKAPYLVTKARRDQAADSVAEELFHSIRDLHPILVATETAVREGMESVVERRGQAESLFRHVNHALKSSLQLMSALKAECPANIVFGAQRSLTEEFELPPKEFPPEDNHEDPEFPMKPTLKEEDFLTGDTGRSEAVEGLVRDEVHIKLEDAMRVFTQNIQACENYATSRFVNFANHAKIATARLHAQIVLLEHIDANTKAIVQILKTFDIDPAVDLVDNAHGVKRSLSQLQCEQKD